jgi:hypothetical protein
MVEFYSAFQINVLPRWSVDQTELMPLKDCIVRRYSDVYLPDNQVASNNSVHEPILQTKQNGVRYFYFYLCSLKLGTCIA